MENSTLNPSPPKSALNVPLTSSQHKNYFQVDFLKALMIFLVIMDHSFTHKFLHQFGSTFWERISIPMLMIIMGFNMGTSFQREGKKTFKELYSKAYFQKKIQRYLLPYLFLYLIHGIIRFIVFYFEIPVNGVYYYDNFDLRYLGYTFFYGPGLWFIPVLFGTILIFPAFYFYYQQFPGFTLFLTYFIEIMTHFLIIILLITYQEVGFPILLLLYSVFSMFSAVGLGLWISSGYKIKIKKDGKKIRNHRLDLIFGLFPLSLLYMIFYTVYYDSNSILIAIPLGDYHFLFFPYSAFFFVVIMNILPENPKGKIIDLIKTISKSTYHILLSQIFYFSIVYQFYLNMYDVSESTPDVFDGDPWNYLWYFPLNVLITFTLGICWKKVEDSYFKTAKQNPETFIGRSLLILTKIAIIAYILWILGPIFYGLTNTL